MMLTNAWKSAARAIASICVLAVMTAGGIAQTDGGEPVDRALLRGVARPVRTAVLNPPIDGIVSEIAVKEGQQVSKGDLLLQMDAGVQEAVAAVAKMRAQSVVSLEQAKLEYEDARVSLARMEEAFEKDAVNKWELRRARLEAEIAKIRVDAAREMQKIAEAEYALELKRLERYTLRAPWDATVRIINVESGATVGRADEIFEIAALDRLEGQIHLPVQLYRRVKVGQTFTVRLGPPVNATTEAKVTVVDPVIDPASQTFRTLFAINNAEMKYPAGMMIELVLPEEPAE